MYRKLSQLAVRRRVETYLKAHDKKFHKSRPCDKSYLGTWYITNGRRIVDHFDDLSVYAASIGLVKPWEEVAV